LLVAFCGAEWAACNMPVIGFRGGTDEVGRAGREARTGGRGRGRKESDQKVRWAHLTFISDHDSGRSFIWLLYSSSGSEQGRACVVHGPLYRREPRRWTTDPPMTPIKDLSAMTYVWQAGLHWPAWWVIYKLAYKAYNSKYKMGFSTQINASSSVVFLLKSMYFSLYYVTSYIAASAEVIRSARVYYVYNRK
jgi:hypothetical protein